MAILQGRTAEAIDGKRSCACRCCSTSTDRERQAGRQSRSSSCSRTARPEERAPAMRDPLPRGGDRLGLWPGARRSAEAISAVPAGTTAVRVRPPDRRARRRQERRLRCSDGARPARSRRDLPPDVVFIESGRERSRSGMSDGLTWHLDRRAPGVDQSSPASSSTRRASSSVGSPGPGVGFGELAVTLARSISGEVIKDGHIRHQPGRRFRSRAFRSFPDAPGLEGQLDPLHVDPIEPAPTRAPRGGWSRHG